MVPAHKHHQQFHIAIAIVLLTKTLSRIIISLFQWSKSL